MKKAIIFLCLSLGVCTFSLAQRTDPKVTITAGFGLLTMPQFAEGLSNILTTALTGGNVRFDDATFSGALIAGVKFSVANRWKYGVDVIYEKFTKMAYNNSNGQFLGESEGKYWSLIPRIDY